MNELAEAIADVRLGPVVEIGDLSLVALLSCRSGPAVDLLEDGLRNGRTTITEVSEQGRVDRIRVRHEGDRPLLLLDGEEILGAKQNRLVNATFLVPAGAEVDLPVSCVERGRWRSESKSFSASDRTVISTIRGTKLRRVAASLSASRTYDADQDSVWAGVDRFLDRTAIISSTHALADGVAARAAEVGSRIEQLKIQDDQVGLAAVRGGRLVSIDLFGGTNLFRRSWRKVAKGLMAEVSGEPTAARATVAERIAARFGVHREPTAAAVSPLPVVAAALSATAQATAERIRAPGSGDTLRVREREVVALALVDGGELFHALLVPRDEAV